MSQQPFHDPLTEPGATGLPDRFFDRFVFNLHPTDSPAPSILLGYGMYPAADVTDGFVILVTPTEQRNLRYSTELSRTQGDGAGPFQFEVVVPNQEWRLRCGPNETGLEFDVTWRARAPHWWSRVEVTNASGEPTSFDHLVQSGRYTGTVTIDGATQSVDRWWGQRDRSRGVRTMSGGQGLHIWYQAQFPDRSVGFLLVEDRQGGRILLEGGVMHEDGTLDDITDVKHALTIDSGLDVTAGTVLVTTESGRQYRIEGDLSARGGYMAGAGYGGHHGKQRGANHTEHDVYPLDGTVSPRTLDSSLTDRLTQFDWDGTAGSGIFEFALSRSSSYTYQPTLEA